MDISVSKQTHQTAILLNNGGFQATNKNKFPLEVTGFVFLIGSQGEGALAEVKEPAIEIDPFFGHSTDYYFEIGKEILIGTIDSKPLRFGNSGKASNRLLTWNEYRSLIEKEFIKRGLPPEHAKNYSYGFFDSYKEYLDLKCDHDIEADVDEEMHCWSE